MPEQRKIELRGRAIPRDSAGDPAFVRLNTDNTGPDKSHSVLHVFTEEEVTIIVNRYIKFQEASALTHKKLAERNRERMKPINDKIREMFHISPSKATNEQISAAVQALVKEKEANR